MDTVLAPKEGQPSKCAGAPEPDINKNVPCFTKISSEPWTNKCAPHSDDRTCPPC